MGPDHRRAFAADSERDARLRMPGLRPHFFRAGAGYAGLVHDEIDKRLFPFPRMVEDLMRGFVARDRAAAVAYPAQGISPPAVAWRPDRALVVRSGRTARETIAYKTRGRRLTTCAGSPATLDSGRTRSA